MVNRARQDERVKRIQLLREAPKAEALPGLAAALKSNAPLEVSVAARIAEEGGLVELLPELEAILKRSLRPESRDRSSVATVAVASACDALGSRDLDLFLECCRAAEFDPAGTLRGRALFALFRLQTGDAMLEAARMLADRNAGVRAAAARAISNGSPLAGVPLLRFKALSGEEEPEVLEQVFESLLALDPEGFVPFSVSLLSSRNEALVNAAAMALGHSRNPAACAQLIDWADALPLDKLDLAFSTLAILRQPTATKYLLEQIRDASVQRAQLAVVAISPFLYEQKLLADVREAAGKRSEVLRALSRVSDRAEGARGSA
jgi:HEAT repeat protein